jgi:outer membrane immunogenic protein
MRTIASALVLAAFATSATAADMPVKAPMKPIIVQPYNWTGFYLGIAGGGGWADTRHTNTINGINSGTVGISGGLFGGTYGYNFQLGSWVLGFEGDFSWSGIRSKFFDNNGSDFCSPAIELECMTNLLWLGTDRGRLGYAWDRLLVYGTAGVAYGKVEATLPNATFLVTSGSNTRTGFVFGGGFEWAFAPAWSLKAEYLRTDLGSKVTYTISNIFPETVSLTNINIVRLGLNYHFR